MTQYHSKLVDDKGRVEWSEEENSVWADLYARQYPLVKDRACQAYIDGIRQMISYNKLDQVDEAYLSDAAPLHLIPRPD